MRRLLSIGRDQFVQEYFQISAETWAAYQRQAGADPHCSARTAAGHACRGYVVRFYGDPKQFVVGVHDRCAVHRGHG